MLEKVRSFMSRTFLIEFGPGIDEETDLFQLGLIDSYGYIELVRYLEREFGLEISDEELLGNFFVSVASIVNFAQQKLGRSLA